MFERFTERARQVVVFAQDEARLLRHNYIGTEHLLLGLLREEEGLAARVLGALNVTVDEVRDRVAQIVGQGDEVTSGQIPFTPRAKKVLEFGLREALLLGHNYVGTEHILLGLEREHEGVAARILTELGADAETVRGEIVRLLGGPAGARAAPRAVTTGAETRQRWQYLVEPLTRSEPDARQGQLNSLGAQGWQLIAVEKEGETLQAFLQRPVPIARSQAPRTVEKWTVGALGPPWSNPATQAAALSVGFLTGCIRQAIALAQEANAIARRDALQTIEQELSQQLHAAAATITGTERPLPRSMKIDTVLEAVSAAKEDLIENQDFSNAAATRDVERRLRTAVKDAVELMARTHSIDDPA